MKKLVLGLALSFFFLTGCKAPQSADLSSAQAASPKSSTSSKASQAGTSTNMEQRTNPAGGNATSTEALKQALEAALQSDMAYADARAAIVRLGWQPVPNPNCMEEIVGGNWKDMCETGDPLPACDACKRMTELQLHGGAAGEAQSRFRHPDSDQFLTVTSFGMLSDWEVAGEDSRMRYATWRFEPAP